MKYNKSIAGNIREQIHIKNSFANNKEFNNVAHNEFNSFQWQFRDSTVLHNNPKYLFLIKLFLLCYIFQHTEKKYIYITKPPFELDLSCSIPIIYSIKEKKNKDVNIVSVGRLIYCNVCCNNTNKFLAHYKF